MRQNRSLFAAPAPILGRVSLLVLAGLMSVSWGADSEVQFANQQTSTSGGKKELVVAKAFLSVNKLPPEKTCEILIQLEVSPEWHINANPPKPESMIATTVTFKCKKGVKLSKCWYPKGEPLELSGIDEKVSVYEGRVFVRGLLEVPAAAAGETEEMQIEVKYQACNEQSCLPPKTIMLSGKLPVASAGDPVESINQKLFDEAERRNPRPR